MPSLSATLLAQRISSPKIDSNLLESTIHTQTLGINSKPNHQRISPAFLSLICMGVLLSIPNNIHAKEDWTITNGATLDTTSNTDKLTISITNKQISATQRKDYKNLEITSSGSITNTDNKNAINVGSNAKVGTITNKGNINTQGTSVEMKGTIANFNNEGTIKNTKQSGLAIFGMNSKIETFNNSGSIGTKGSSVLFINSTTDYFINSGTIKDESGTSYAITVSSSTAKNFTNIGTITGGIQGIYFNSATIDNFTNKGTINATDTSAQAVYMGHSNVKNITNEGYLKGATGIQITGSTITNVTNKGTIESTGDTLNLGAIVAYDTKIAIISNEGILSAKKNGINYGSGVNVDEIINKGTIKAEGFGINFTGSTPAKLGKITLADGSSIESKLDAISINANNKKYEVGSIDIQKGATIKSESGAAINVASNSHITGDITIAGKIEAKTGIANAGNIAGNISALDNTDFSIENKGGGNIVGG
uniref:hypothetical protein n=1 Tax=Helicobacter mesocricetorum TaxID=87012 RepID=UPI0013158806